MSVQDSVDIPLEAFGGYAPAMPPANLPSGSSPLAQDVVYPEGAVRTRPGLSPLFLSAAGNPSFNGLESFQTAALVKRLIAWDSLGNFYKENPSGALELLVSNGTYGLFMSGCTALGREYMGFFNANGGFDIPRQYDDTNYDRVSQGGPGSGPSVSDYLPQPQNIPLAGSPIVATIAPSPAGAVRGNPVTVQVATQTPIFGFVEQPNGERVREIVGYTTTYTSHTVDTIITFTTTAPHGFLAGQIVIIAGCGDSAMNGAYSIQSVTSTTFVVSNQSINLGEATGGGTATVNSPAITRFNNVVTVITFAAHGFQVGWTVLISGINNLVAGTSIASIVQSDGVVTVTTSSPHRLAATGQIIIAGVADGTYNGQFEIQAVPTPTTFTYQAITANPSSTGGTASTTFDGSFTILSVPSPTSFTYADVGPNQSGTGTTIGASATTAAAVASNIATLTFAANPGFSVGQLAIVSGFTGADVYLNGSFTITAVTTVSPWTISFALTHADAAATTAGTVSVDEALATIQGNVSAGLHQMSVCFVTRQGYVTRPAPPTSFNAAGGKLASVSGIAIGPANIVQRILIATQVIFPPGTTGPFFTTQAMVINDNTTTAALIDFSDLALGAGQSMESRFSLVVLGESSHVQFYNGRLSWIGERNTIQNFLNLGFDGGWALGAGTGGSDIPLGWQSDSVNGAGGSRTTSSQISGDAYVITGDGVTAIRGMLTQSVLADFLGVAIIEKNTSYSVRVRAYVSALSATGNLTIEIFSPTAGSLGSAIFPLSAMSTVQQEFVASLLLAQTTIPPDVELHVYANGTVANGIAVTVDNIEPFLTTAPYNTSTARISFAFDQESYHQTTGLAAVRINDGQQLRAQFVLRGNLYFAKERYLAHVTDDGQNEPAFWPVVEDSNTIGICGPNAVDAGEEWAAFACRSGVYIFWGSDPVKISQDIYIDASGTGKANWSQINWAAQHTIWVRIDQINKMILVGAPINGATSPNVIFMMDYKFAESGEDAAGAAGLVYSSFTGKLLMHGSGRRWAYWNVTSNSAVFSERPDGTAHFLVGNAVGNGLIYDMLDSQKSDNGVAINTRYQTYGGPSTEEQQALQLGSHRILCDYVTGRAVGSGQLGISAITPYRTTPVRAVTLAAAPLDFERNVNIHGERIAWELSTNAAGAWMQVEKFIPSVKQDPMIPVRGLSA